ncbi:SWIM zinc finger [Brevibacterium aurantiacum]|uniref:SWIM zinc finger n=1 Tax=Brevibacterium aurantiacum TaxID=273384 RepID=A0A2H1IRN4_BREAU|nr:SWIM zinc finger family protein [Brevibacterium aurantiacum]SMX77834.1 SWIM zinc finger [Brevibacterium aurantiacum]
MAQPEFGATSWGRSWLRTIERTGGMPNPQLPKARSLARNQKATLTIAAEGITAAVADGSTTHQVSIQIPRWSADQTTVAAPLLTAANTASVVGDLPDSLADALTKAAVPVAAALDELAATCTCRTRAHPCAHILTALYGLVLLIDERPMTALEIRARDLPRTTAIDENWIELTALRADEFYAVAHG